MTNNIMVGVPCYGDIKIDTVATIINTISQTKGRIEFKFVKGTYLFINRQKLASMAKKAGVSHLFFLDADMKAPGDIINRLMAHNKPIIGAHYNSKKHPLQTTVRMLENGRIVIPDRIPESLFQCFSVATGCMLVDINVFNTMSKPYFFYDVYDEEKDEFVGEDVWFCRRARDFGIETWCDPTIEVKHIGDYEY